MNARAKHSTGATVALSWALHYASEGFPVFPVWPMRGATCRCKLETRPPEKCHPGKHPITRRGLHDASVDRTQIEAWFNVGEELNVGIAVPDGIVVVDVDPRNGGNETYVEWLTTRGLPATRFVRTGGGGMHLYYRVPAGFRFPGKPGRGIDLKQLGGFVLAPPSNHESGGAYELADNRPIADAPPWLVALGNKRLEPLTRESRELEFDEELTEDLDHAAIAKLLSPHYQSGNFHRGALAVGGFLKNRGYTSGDAEKIVGDMAEQSGSSDPDARAKDALGAWRYVTPAGYSWLREWVPAHTLEQLERLAPDKERAVREEMRRALLAAAPGGAAPANGVALEARRQALPANDGVDARADELRSDLGNARRLVRLHGHDLRFFAARGIWYVWNGVRWQADETGAVIRLAKSAVESLLDDAKAEPDDEKRKAKLAWAAKCQDKSRITNLIALAESEPGVPVTAEDLDADPWLLNVANGVLDLRTGCLTAPDRKMLMTKLAPVPYIPEARSELWQRFVQKLTGSDEELATYIQRALGYSLFGAWREKMFWFGYGNPDGGKSTLLGVIGDILGDYHVGADASTWMIQTNTGGNRGDVTRLLGARLVTTVEVRASARFDQQLMKKVTGGDALVAAAKYEGEIEFKPTFALWFGANDRPMIPDDDAGFWNRVRCVPFTNPVPRHEQDKALREKLSSADHAPAVLAWLVAGCLAWQRDGIGTCRAVERATEDYRRSMNQAADFFDECCELTGKDDDHVNAGQLRVVYDTWCKLNGVQRPLAGKAWKRRLQELGVRGGGDDSRIGGHRVYRGLRLRESGAPQ